ncbi:MAG: S-layer homology domain-containing protein [Clostridia bacterium]|nr:S-layer homology domain-containing protein [Clostridia bacterium]
MKLSKRILSAFLAILMVCSIAATVSAANVTFTDVSGHWAANQIQYLVDKGVLNGYKQPNGTYKFNPNGEVTRAEFIKMLDAAFGLKATTGISYSDVKTSDWFYPYFAMAAAQGYILNYGTSVNPNGKITREEALSLLVRYLDLPENEMASTSYFADYHTISENYRSYVLRGIYAGLTDGYNEGGAKVFKPKNTLTRAEALTILYRAAGCIFQTNAYSRDNGAADTNNVIGAGNVILNGIPLNGRVIVSEGATSGIVSIYGCTIPDTLYIRGTADVVLDDSKVKNVVIENGCKLSIQNGTEIESLTVYGKSTINVYSGISLDLLDVENGADGTEVKGDGLIKLAYINASGFKSSMVPTEFKIGNNLTATFAGTQYQGSSDAQESFSMTPFITSDEANYYLNLFPAENGTVYYYFTNGATPPTTSSYDSYFDASSFNGSITVKAGQVVTERTYSASSVKEFEYVVLQLQDGSRKYAPVVIPNSNTDGNGFSTTPYLADETTIKFVADQAGTLYWFYAKDGSKLTQAEFMEEYAEADSAMRGESTIASGRTLSLGLNTKYLKNYDYVALMLKAAGSSYYTPVIVSAGDNGFVDEPTLKNVGTVSFKAGISGELYYYYSKDADLPTPDDFKGVYNKVDGDLAKSIDVTKNKADTFEYDPDESEDYPYLIIALRNSDKEYMQPVALNINYQTGFRDLPEIADEVTIQFRTEDDGEVMYYYTKSAEVPNSYQFNERYDDLASRYKDKIDVDDSWEKVEYSQDKAKDYPYMAFMFIDDQDREFTPVVIELDASANTGFTVAPYIIDDAVQFKTEGAGEVWYFYAKTEFSLAASEFEEEYDDARYAYTETVRAGSLDGFELDEDLIDDYPYIVLAFLPEDKEDDRRFCFPVVLDIEEGSTGGTGLSVDAITADEVVITTNIDGKLYYYFSNSSSVNSDKFEDRYDDADDSDYESCDDGEEIDIPVDEDDDYNYLIVCIKVTNADGKEAYLTPVVIDLDERTSDSSDEDDGSTTSKTGLTIDDYNNREREIKFTSQHDGTVTITLDAGNIKSELKTITVSEDESYEYNYDAIYNMITNDYLSQLVGGGKAAYIKIQLKTDSDTYREISIPIVD